MRMLRLWLTGVRVNTGWLAILVPFLFSLPNSSSGQDFCDPAQRPSSTVEGGFTVAKRVCVNTPVNVTNTKPTAIGIKYIFGYTKDSSLANTGSDRTAFTFTKAGRYKILQAGSINATAMIHCEEIEVLPLDPVKFTAQVCLGRRVTLKIDPSTLGQYDSYTIRWGDGVTDPKSRGEILADPSHSYNIGSSNTPTIVVEGAYNSVDCRSSQTSPPLTLLSTATQPVITALTTTSDKAIEIKYQTSTGSSIELYQKVNGTYTATGQKGADVGTFTVEADAKQVQCFQLVAQDACNNTSTASLKSDEVCSLVLDVQAANKQNNLKWQPYAGTLSGNSQLRFFRITRNDAPLGGTITDARASTFSDASVIECGTQYCYSIAATISGVGQTIVTSAPVCVNGINGDPPGNIGPVLVSVEDGHPRLVTTPPTAIGPTDSYTMIVSRASGPSGSFQPVAFLDRKSTYADESADPSSGSYCYQVTYQNGCGLQSNPSATVCSVFLQAKTDKGIDWNADSPFTPETVASYTLEVVDDSNGSKQEITVGSNTHYDPDPNDPNLQSQKYRILAVSDGGLVSYSNYYTFRREARIVIPDAFTPNGDGMNDTFVAKGIYLDRFTMNIYSRWGEVVYSTTDKSQGWDGKISGQDATPGQYMYRIEVTDLTGQKTVRTGALLLIR